MSRHTRKAKFFTGIIVLAVLVIIYCILNGNPTSVSDPSVRASYRASVRFQPTVEAINGSDVIWQIPDSPKAVLYIAQGCDRSPASFWDESPECPNCAGLPEHRQIVLDALDRGFAVLVISSMESCFKVKEKENITRIINWWVKIHKIEKLPLTALGVSAGGNFVSSLAAEMQFSSITLMIAEGNFYYMDVSSDYPPTLFVHMPKDPIKKLGINKSMKFLSQKGIPVKEVTCMAFPLTPNLFSDRIQGLNLTTSLQVYQLFREEGFIDENGYLKDGFRRSDWEKAIRARKFVINLNHILEELNLAFGYHEITSLQSDSIFKWFESYLS